MRSVFLDTVGLIAIWDRADQWHNPAEVIYQQLIRDRVRFVSSTLVMFECGNASARRPYREGVDEYRRALARTGGLVVPTEADQETAWVAYHRQGLGGAGIVDHVSFAIMRRLGIREAFKNDRHFKAAGFVTLF